MTARIPEKSTRAAAHHLKDLYNQFGDWYLAMAAYNSGPGTVQNAVKRTGYADFWELYRRNVLPKETRNYVPIILAVTIMAKNPAQYGLDSVVKEKPLAYDTVKIDYAIDLRLAAECVDATTERLARPEPQPAPPDHAESYGKGFGKGSGVRTPLADRDGGEISNGGRLDPRRQARLVALSQGASRRIPGRDRPHLSHDARSHRRSERSHGQFTRTRNPPHHSHRRGQTTDSSTFAHAITHYKVRKGDTVESVARNFGVSAK